MREASWLDELEIRMLRDGFAPSYVARVIAELIDHRAALAEEAQQRGLTAEQALEFAEEKLGRADPMLGQLIFSRRRRSWCSRHPVMLFGFVPLILLILSFVGGALYLGAVGQYNGWWDRNSPLTTEEWFRLVLAVPVFHFVLMLSVPAFFCRLARQFCYGWKWAFTACLVLAVHGLFHDLGVIFPIGDQRGMVSWGYGISSQLGGKLWTALPPLLLFAIYYFLATRRQERVVALRNKP